MPFPRVKGHNYDMANRVPLIARWPQGIAEGDRRVPQLVSLIDLAPTFLELLGIDSAKAGMAPITGASLLDLIRGKPELTRQNDPRVLGQGDVFDNYPTIKPADAPTKKTNKKPQP